MTRPLLLGGALGLNLLLLLAARPVSIAWIHPVAPPLTHIPEMGEPVLYDAAATPAPPGPGPGRPPPGQTPGQPPGRPPGPPPLRGLAGALDRVVSATGDPTQRAGVAALRKRDQDVLPRALHAMDLRRAVQDDAVAIALALGPERVGAILAAREDLSTRLGEGKAWEAAIRAVSP